MCVQIRQEEDELLCRIGVSGLVVWSGCHSSEFSRGWLVDTRQEDRRRKEENASLRYNHTALRY